MIRVIARSRAVYALLAVLAAAPVAGRCTSGEDLLRELRQQVETQRHTMDEAELRRVGDGIGRNPAFPGDLVECTPDAISAFNTSGQTSSRKWDVYIYNATYTRAQLPIGNQFCVYLTRPVNRGLTVEEARDLYVADHLEFPRYQPPPADVQAGEEQFAQLRKAARVKRDDLSEEKRAQIEFVLEHAVQCSDAELTRHDAWRETGYMGEEADPDGNNFVWAWSHSDDGDMCMFNRSPLHRALTLDEAREC